MKIGQQVFIERIDARQGVPKDLLEGIISKVGRKYFYVQFHGEEARFFADSLRHDSGNYSPRLKLWPSREKHERNRELTILFSRLREHLAQITTSDISLEEAKEIANILGI